MENFFKLVLGESNILPGKTFTEYDVFFDEEKMRCKIQKQARSTLLNLKILLMLNLALDLEICG